MTVIYRGSKEKRGRPLEGVSRDTSAPPWVTRRHEVVSGPVTVGYGLVGTVDVGKVRVLDDRKILCRCPVCRRLVLAKLSRDPVLTDGRYPTVGEDVRCPCPACGFVWQFRDGAIVYRDGDAPWL